MAKAVVSLRDVILQNHSNPTVVELGNQRFKCSKNLREAIYENLKLPQIVPSSVKEFYFSIGFKKYLAVDVNTEKDAVAMDLNTVLKDQYKFTEEFSLVTNNGTGEHIFNQFSVFKNMHNLCKVKGYMIHNLPFTGYLDHGFYNFQPNLFVAIANHNSYNILDIWIGTSDGERIEKINPYDNYDSKKSDLLNKFSLNNWNQNLLIMVTMEKTKSNEFSIPIQGMYSDAVTDKNIKTRYNLK